MTTRPSGSSSWSLTLRFNSPSSTTTESVRVEPLLQFRLTNPQMFNCRESNDFYIFVSSQKCSGPSTNWIVGTRFPIGVDNSTLVIDKLKGSGEVSAGIQYHFTKWQMCPSKKN